MYVMRREYLGVYRARPDGGSVERSQESHLERVAAEGSGANTRACIREVSSTVPKVVAYPWVCLGCGSHVRHGDVCAFCGDRGRRVVRRWR